MFEKWSEPTATRYCATSSMALRSIQIHQELLERTRLHERDELEHMATSKRLRSSTPWQAGWLTTSTIRWGRWWRCPR